MYPITAFVVEDISADTRKGCKKWNTMFSPLQVGKKWFYKQLAKLGRVETKEGWETFEMRNAHGLKKSKSKMSEVFEAHCVDSWTLANWFVGGHTKPEYKRMLCITPLRFHRRQLHVTNPTKGNIRKAYGGTMSLGFKRGSLVKHKSKGLTYIGGTSKGRISLREIGTGRRIGQNFRVEDCKFLSYNSWRPRLLPTAKAEGIRLGRIR